MLDRRLSIYLDHSLECVSIDVQQRDHYWEQLTEEEDGEASNQIDRNQQASLLEAVMNTLILKVGGRLDRHLE